MSPRPRVLRRRGRSALMHSGWPFLLPGLVVAFVLVLYPLIYAGVVSFFDYDLVTGASYFIGWENYAQLTSGDFPASLKVTALFLVEAVTAEIVLGTGLALVLNIPRLRRIRPYILPALLLPMMMAPVVSGATFKLLLAPHTGLVSGWLGGIDILGDRRLALQALVVMDVWMWTPFVVLLVAAARAGIDEQVIEAATLDGTSAVQRFRFIVLPALMPALVVAVLFRVIDAIKLADIPYVMTQGGPGSSTTLVGFQIFRTSFATFNLGLGAAMSIVVVLILLVPVLLLYRRITA